MPKKKLGGMSGKKRQSKPQTVNIRADKVNVKGDSSVPEPVLKKSLPILRLTEDEIKGVPGFGKKVKLEASGKVTSMSQDQWNGGKTEYVIEIENIKTKKGSK